MIINNIIISNTSNIITGLQVACSYNDRDICQKKFYNNIVWIKATSISFYFGIKNELINIQLFIKQNITK